MGRAEPRVQTQTPTQRSNSADTDPRFPSITALPRGPRAGSARPPVKGAWFSTALKIPHRDPRVFEIRDFSSFRTVPRCRYPASCDISIRVHEKPPLPSPDRASPCLLAFTTSCQGTICLLVPLLGIRGHGSRKFASFATSLSPVPRTVIGVL